MSMINVSNDSMMLINQNNTAGCIIVVPNLWNVLSAFTLLTCVLGIIFNSTLLLLLVRVSTLRTSFNVYLINLLVANLICVMISYPMDLMTNLNSMKWLIGNAACTAYLYNVIVLQAGIFHCHLLIAVNRIWAVVHPISYRSIHSVRTACCLCLVMWVYVHVVAAPEFILDALYYRQPVETYGCFINMEVLATYDLIAEILFFNLPHLIMVLALPIVWVAKARQRQGSLARSNVVRPARWDEARRLAGLQLKLRRGGVDEGQHTNQVTDSTNYRHGTTKEVQDTKVALPTPPMVRRKSHGYFLLTLLTLSVLICWTPIDVYYLLKSIRHDFNVPLFYQVAEILFSLQTTMDPLVFFFAMKHLRLSQVWRRDR
ncbi:hypothetical protein BV898_00452 [Hypsibius exemplaris]|uniref:G-protein coupled receptors family 1 profile domain-containing protein n=1 Tax=Hypsibius exemplaris TaxID=2072580 RepID=A0A1W0XDT5_HYPEX|nr:hypothetical protein BV898_00452 [Hypsibius exemplaris]